MLIVDGTLRSKILETLRDAPNWWPTAGELARNIIYERTDVIDASKQDHNEWCKLERAIYRELDLLQSAGLVDVHDAAAGTMNAWSAKC